MYISSINNDFIKETAKLKEKKYRDLTNTFLIEGEHLVKEAKKNDLIKTIIVLEDFTYETDLEKIIVTKEVMKKLSDNPSIPKVMAIVEKKECTRIGNKVIILDRLQDPGNLGTIIRSAVAFDFDTLILSDDTVDLYNPKVIRSTQGMLFNINIKRCNIKETIEKLKEKDYLILGTKVNGGTSVKDYSVNKKFALIIGNEGGGISKEILDLCEDYLYINMVNKCESLNAGVAASILMYELGGKNEVHKDR